MKRNWKLLFAITFLAIGFAGCAKKENVNLVDGVPPVSTSLAGIAPTLSDMAKMSATERGAYLERNWPHLQTDVAYYLRGLGKIKPDQAVSRVVFRFGSLENVSAESHGGARREGFFRDQLVALVHLDGVQEPIPVIVQCLNGTFVPIDKLNQLQAVGEHTPVERFTIGRREGLVHHVDFPLAIDLAERFNLPLYSGRKIIERNRITVAQARAMESTTDVRQVTVKVVEGDVFDLRHMTFTPSPRRKSKS